MKKEAKIEVIENGYTESFETKNQWSIQVIEQLRYIDHNKDLDDILVNLKYIQDKVKTWINHIEGMKNAGFK